ncbi:GIY-YIG nuclease family protein [Alteromonas sp. KUL42]|uniref:GIY-YIG nuclease family protein n=1 Tax=Alteromonas sp. KUL42 TaxID=2480797 RepID=UPI0007912CF2|nr:GIY-YIG nuclease family protein [Alteromonas sp. KUL42]KXJ60553.1 MAG: endonuclease [Alteromonas sp. Nap_26]TAP38363.1 GIY-YIG nuclease family protein [Alteromonas sp. KUL42]
MAQSITANTGNTHHSKSNTQWYLYLIENKLGQLYTGITTDPARRMAQHSGELKGGAKALKGKAPLSFRLVIKVESRSQASVLEARIKKLSRNQKNAIIASGRFEEFRCVKSTFQKL